mmetsp:Transcript_3503/g.10203  ORF Transcript_3503/g.10203 Transcript_3503/m.10203 type:complete len:205 (-) Transcript_3503:202-816(-)
MILPACPTRSWTLVLELDCMASTTTTGSLALNSGTFFATASSTNSAQQLKAPCRTSSMLEASSEESTPRAARSRISLWAVAATSAATFASASAALRSADSTVALASASVELARASASCSRRCFAAVCRRCLTSSSRGARRRCHSAASRLQRSTSSPLSSSSSLSLAISSCPACRVAADFAAASSSGALQAARQAQKAPQTAISS